VDVASQGETEAEALSNLKEALELYFEPPDATRPPMGGGFGAVAS
jgi:predicted RNase H-like HicB family nuclease